MNVPLMILLIFCLVMGVVLGAFFCVHVMQVVRNQTSYEGWSFSPQLQQPEGANGDAADGGAAESCTPPPPPAGTSGDKTDEQGDKEEKEEEEDDPDRGTTCRVKRKDPPKAEDGGLPPGQWVSKHDTGSTWANIAEVVFPPMNSFGKVALAEGKKAQ